MTEEFDAEAEISALSRSGDRSAQAAFLALGPRAFPAVRRGLGHSSWKVRRDCLRFLDHHVDPEMALLILDRLRDEHPDVRKWAVHALGCDHCKEESALGFDPVPHLMDVIRDDSSLRVRRSAVVALAWTQPPSSRIADFLGTLLDSETDEKIRFHAEGGVSRHSHVA
jgi:hypothetical protein